MKKKIEKKIPNLNLPLEAEKKDTWPLMESVGIERTSNQLIKELERLSKKKGVVPVSYNNDEK